MTDWLHGLARVGLLHVGCCRHVALLTLWVAWLRHAHGGLPRVALLLHVGLLLLLVHVLLLLIRCLLLVGVLLLIRMLLLLIGMLLLLVHVLLLLIRLLCLLCVLSLVRLPPPLWWRPTAPLLLPRCLARQVLHEHGEFALLVAAERKQRVEAAGTDMRAAGCVLRALDQDAQAGPLWSAPCARVCLGR